LAGPELEYLAEVVNGRALAAHGRFSRLCETWLVANTGVGGAQLTQSCTRALELAAMLAGVHAGDEVIMPSFTFASTANAVALRGGVPVFVDIRSDTLNIDEALIEPAITPRTKAVVPVHYAGVCAEMDAITAIGARCGLTVIEDAAQALLSTYHGRPAGSLGDLGCFSFHQTKNVTAGEGGALLVKDAKLVSKARIVSDKGVDRESFLAGRKDHYEWVELGSSFGLSELSAAFLYAQLEASERFGRMRQTLWRRYDDNLAQLESEGLLRRPFVPEHCGHNGHLYYVLLADKTLRDSIIRALAGDGITAPFHYIPLHTSEAGRRLGRAQGPLENTERASACLLRLPLHAEMTPRDVDRVVERLHSHLRNARGATAPRSSVTAR
jgi:dTDP-4-amino-4,6-dideoxygalactose transaminase